MVAEEKAAEEMLAQELIVQDTLVEELLAEMRVAEEIMVAEMACAARNDDAEGTLDNDADWDSLLHCDLDQDSLGRAWPSLQLLDVDQQ